MRATVQRADQWPTLVATATTEEIAAAIAGGADIDATDTVGRTGTWPSPVAALTLPGRSPTRNAKSFRRKRSCSRIGKWRQARSRRNVSVA